uniref:Retrotransposon protein, putative, Ty1-copia subclass n=1 Tax=Tanacetum cinerariifolium TaxID=118510 RepID=A0A699J1T1_TANCI|nr:hypothetical protein [Tanacetum cinerariifolium]
MVSIEGASYFITFTDDFSRDGYVHSMKHKHEHKPGEVHWTGVKTIIKYLRNTKDMGFVYLGRPETKLKVTCYADAGFQTNKDDTKSQSGYVFVLSGRAVDWKSVKKSTIDMSSTEVEYNVAVEASMEAVWVRKVIDGLRDFMLLEIKKILSHYQYIVE